MLRLIGGAMLIAGSVGFSLRIISKLTARLTMLRSLADAIDWMERELSFQLTPMPVLLKTLAEQRESPAAPFFAACHKGLAHLNEEPLSAVWTGAAERYLTVLTGEDRAIVTGLGLVLGRYDGEEQRKALRQTAQTLQGCCEDAKEEKTRLGRVYGVLGLTAGVFLVVLLL